MGAGGRSERFHLFCCLKEEQPDWTDESLLRRFLPGEQIKVAQHIVALPV